MPSGQHDEQTFIKYINGKQSGSGQGYFWAINAPDMAMVLKWIPNRQHKNVAELVAGFSGVLQSDGFEGYRSYAASTDEVTLAACWAHTFRKFRDALDHEPTEARAMMHLIGKLYKLEEQWDQDQISVEQRKELRTELSVPIANQIKDKLDVYRPP